MTATVIPLDARRIPNFAPHSVCPDCNNTGEYDDGVHFGFCTCPHGVALYEEMVALVDGDYAESPEGGVA